MKQGFSRIYELNCRTISRTMGTRMLMMATLDANSVETAAVSVMITMMIGAGKLLSTRSDWPSVFVKPVFYKAKFRSSLEN